MKCEECDEPIPEARRKAVPNTKRCVKCQERIERGDKSLEDVVERMTVLPISGRWAEALAISGELKFDEMFS